MTHALPTRVMIADNVFTRLFVLPRKGDVHDGHAHSFDHITLLAKGTVLMRTQEAIEPPQVRTFMAPALLVTPKGIVHEFEAVTDDCILCCVHAIRNGDGLDDIAPQEITREEASALVGRYPLVQTVHDLAGGPFLGEPSAPAT